MHLRLAGAITNRFYVLEIRGIHLQMEEILITGETSQVFNRYLGFVELHRRTCHKDFNTYLEMDDNNLRFENAAENQDLNVRSERSMSKRTKCFR